MNPKYDELKINVADELFDMIRGVDNKAIDNLSFGFTLNEAIFNTPERKDALKKARLSFDRALSSNFSGTLKQIIEHPVLVKKFGEVFTPSSLVNSMLDYLPRKVWSNPNYKWIDNSCGSGHFLVEIKNRLMISLEEVIEDAEEREAHILQNMIYGVDIQYKNVYLTILQLDPNFKHDLYCNNIAQHDALTFDYWDGEKFHIVVGNPPYNDSSRSKLGGKTLWDAFVQHAIDNLLVDNGYMTLVHPSRWRNPGDDYWNVMTSQNIMYLNVNDTREGQKTFKKATTFDWYIMQKKDYAGLTVVDDATGKRSKINLTDWAWLPNGVYDTFKACNAKVGDDKVEVLYSRSAYGSDKAHMSLEFEQGKFEYPCVYYYNRQNALRLIYSNTKDNGFFNVPKVVFTSGGVSINTDCAYYDEIGEYGLSQFSFGIQGTKDYLDKVFQATKTFKFKEMMLLACVSKDEINRKVISQFKKDFWKEFVDEDGNEI